MKPQSDVRVNGFVRTFALWYLRSIPHHYLKNKRSMPRRKQARSAPRPRLAVTDIFGSGAQKKMSWFNQLVDALTRFFGTIWFLLLNVAVFACWLAINLGWFSGIKMFDPFPFTLLTTIVSLEAIILAIIVLMSQNRASHIGDIREEVDFEVNVQAEKEITKILNILDEVQHRLGISHVDDQELQVMKRRLDIKRIEEKVRKRIAEE